MKDIKNSRLDQLKKELARMSESAYRVKQILSWLYRQGVDDFSQMSDLPQALRGRLKRRYFIGGIELIERLGSADGTEKFLFKLNDGNFTETVLIRAKKRTTICISTQVGCKFACSFCASGAGGFARNLTLSEITSQILFLRCNLKKKITNYVFMGIGEPLDNYENLSSLLLTMSSPEAMDIAAKRITVSTCGLVPGIKRLSDLGLPINLSLSLHATNDQLRDEIVPVNRRYPLRELIGACEDYARKTEKRITLEYVLIQGKNDSLKDAEELAAIAGRLKAKINLIPYSVVAGFCFKKPAEKVAEAFMKRLIKKGAKVTLRESKGSDIGAACGQLTGRRQ